MSFFIFKIMNMLHCGVCTLGGTDDSATVKVQCRAAVSPVSSLENGLLVRWSYNAVIAHFNFEWVWIQIWFPGKRKIPTNKLGLFYSHSSRILVRRSGFSSGNCFISPMCEFMLRRHFKINYYYFFCLSKILRLSIATMDTSSSRREEGQLKLTVYHMARMLWKIRFYNNYFKRIYSRYIIQIQIYNAFQIDDRWITLSTNQITSLEYHDFNKEWLQPNKSQFSQVMVYQKW